MIRCWLNYLQIRFSHSFICLFILLIYEYRLHVTNMTVMVQRLEIIYSWQLICTLKSEESLPSNSLRVLLAISLISIRDKDSE